MPQTWSGGLAPNGVPIGIPIGQQAYINVLKRKATDVGFDQNKVRKTTQNQLIPQRKMGSYFRPYSSGNYRNRYMFKKKKKTGPYWQLSNSLATRHVSGKYPAPEVKIDDLAIGTIAVPTPITSAGVLFNAINQITQGTTNATRIGGQINIKSIAWKLDFDINSAATTTSIRFIVLWDRQPNTYGASGGSALLVTDILATANFTSFMNIVNTERFVVLRNSLIALSGGGPQTAFLEDYVKVNMVSKYLNTVSDQPTTGALVALFLSDQPTNTPTVNGFFRTRFTDC